MKTLVEFFPSWTQPLGWTLVHSLWQALVIVGLTTLSLRFISLKASRARYAIACAALGLMLITSIGTFLYLSSTHTTSIAIGQAARHYSFSMERNSGPLSLSDLTGMVTGVLNANMQWIMLIWTCGALIFSLRLAGSWWYVSRLRSEAEIVSDEWNERLQTLSQRLGINKAVTLAESSRISSPIVIGFLKPFILVPAAMLSNLSPEQIETIMIHELTHIRRHDYLVNLIQSFIETIFFFNPFVWTVSNIIRREREYCCDDAVVENNPNAIAYARALAHLEEVRLTRSGFALSLAENKNQLLNRIKRIMETSAKNYSGKDRIIPVLLLLVGLTCASWLSIKNESEVSDENVASKQFPADTVIKKNSKSAQYSRKSVTVYDEEGEPHEEITEEYDGDESLRPFVFAMPSMPDMVIDIPAIAPMPLITPMPAISPDVFISPNFDMGFYMDTIPAPGFQYGNNGDWEEFSKAFEEKFRAQFGDFYKSHEKDFEKMMKEMGERFGDRFGDDFAMQFQKSWSDHDWGNAADLKEIEREMEAAQEQAMRAQEDAMEQLNDLQMDRNEEMVGKQKEMEQRAFKMQEQAAELHARQADRSADMQLREAEMRAMEKRMKVFEEQLRVELVKDGYLKKEEALETLNWKEDGNLEVNGRKIKDEDKKKYNDLHERYFRKDTRNYRHVE